MIILYKMLLAHLVGDFLLQPAGWVKAKEQKKLAAYQLYIHVLVHVFLVMVLVWQKGFFWWAFLLGLLHLVIDSIKLLFQQEKTKRIFFFADQVAHLVSIYCVWRFYNGDVLPWFRLAEEQYIILALLLVFITTPSSFFVKIFISKWVPEPDMQVPFSLQNAGQFIGIIERGFVFAFVATHNLAAVGFLIAAKSVFRFGDLREAKDRKLTEYVLIGTLSSFGLAMIAGGLYQMLVLNK